MDNLPNVTFAAQYGTPCVTVREDDTAESLMDRCWKSEAVFEEDGPGDYVYVVQFPGRPQEIYTPLALTRTFSQRRKDLP
jgi:hypothetical protein